METAKFVLKIPFDLGLMDKSKRGAADAPDEVEKEAQDFFLSESGKEWGKNLKWLNVEINNSNFDETAKNIEKAAKSAIGAGKFIGIGGDHSISYGLIKGSKNKCEKLVYFDAHLDCQDDFLPPSHEDILRAVVSENIFKPEDILVIGVRNYTKEELEFIKNKKIKVIFAKDIFENDITWLCEELKKFCNGKKIYISVDIDVVDPAFAPGTGWQEPGGISSRDLIQMIQKVSSFSDIIAADICEISPKMDQNRTTARLGAKILVEIFSASG